MAKWTSVPPRGNPRPPAPSLAATSRSQQQQQHLNPASLRSSVAPTTTLGKSPLELAYMRRVFVREQKRYLIIRRLEDELPATYMLAHCGILGVWVVLIVALQIALIVYKSSLYYVCAGFWVGAYFIICIVLTAYLGKCQLVDTFEKNSVRVK